MTDLDRKLAERVIATGDTTPGNWNMVADILELVANYTEGWTNRCDDAMRIPEVLWEASMRLRQCAAEVEEEPTG